MSSVTGSQGQTFLRLLAEHRPHVATDRNLPGRIQQRLTRERRFGSRDRKLYRELLYTAIRFLPWIDPLLARSEDEALRAVTWLCADTPATRALKRALVGDWPALPPTVAAKAQQLGRSEPLVPAWFRGHCPAAFESPNLDVLHTRAPLWLRVQTSNPAPIFAEFAERQWQWREADVLPSALEVISDVDVTQTDAYQRGLIEVQDLGSQLILEAVRPVEGGRWLDACAGAGGKTLQLARLLGSSGHVDASDPRREALAELRMRATRAGTKNITLLHENAPSTLYDGVLVDAPCSGTGTWRRSPHLKWCTTEADVVFAAQLQREILSRYAGQVRAGGVLVYATCSLSDVENGNMAAAFLREHPEFLPAKFSHTFDGKEENPGLIFLPATHNTDGFFVAAFRRN